MTSKLMVEPLRGNEKSWESFSRARKTLENMMMNQVLLRAKNLKCQPAAEKLEYFFDNSLSYNELQLLSNLSALYSDILFSYTNDISVVYVKNGTIQCENAEKKFPEYQPDLPKIRYYLADTKKSGAYPKTDDVVFGTSYLFRAVKEVSVHEARTFLHNDNIFRVKEISEDNAAFFFRKNPQLIAINDAHYPILGLEKKTVDEKKRSFTVKTPFGDMRVYAKHEGADNPSDYPGVYVDLVTPAGDILIACIEYDSGEDHLLQACIYGDCMNDEPSPEPIKYRNYESAFAEKYLELLTLGYTLYKKNWCKAYGFPYEEVQRAFDRGEKYYGIVYSNLETFEKTTFRIHKYMQSLFSDAQYEEYTHVLNVLGITGPCTAAGER